MLGNRRTATIAFVCLALGSILGCVMAQTPPNPPFHVTPWDPTMVPPPGSVTNNVGTVPPPLTTTSWTAIGPAALNAGQTVSGRIAGVAADPLNANILYIAAAGGGVWKTTDSGTTWNQLTDTQQTLAMGCIAVAPSNGSVIYAGTGEANNSADSQYGDGFLVSTDGGATWIMRTGPSGIFNSSHLTCSKVVVDPTNPNIAYAALGNVGDNASFTTGTGVYKTTDGGVTWTNTTASIDVSNSWSDVAIDLNTPQTLYASIGAFYATANAGVYKSINSGGTWTGPLTNLPRNGSNALTGRISIALSKNNSNTVYVQAANTNTGAVLSIVRSDDGGTTSTPIPAPTNYMGGQGWYDQALIADQANAAIVYAIGGSGGVNVYRSANSGATWTSMSAGALVPHVDHHAATFDANDLLIVGNDGGVYRLSNPAGPTWVDLNANLNTIQFEGIATHPTDTSIALGGSQDNGTEKMSAGNPVWNTTDGGDGGLVRFSLQTPTNVYRVSPVGSFGTANFFRKSADTGNTWSAAVTGLNGNDPMNFYPPFTVDSTNGNHALFGSNKIYETTNFAVSWTALGNTGFSGNSIDAIGVAASSPTNTFDTANGGFFASTSQILVTNNHGTTWTQRNLPVSGRVADIAVDPTTATTAYAVISTFNATGHVFKTIDSGATWTNISGNLPDLPTWVIRIDPTNLNVLYIGNDTGVWQTTNGGTNWARFATGLPNVQVLDLDLNNGLRILGAGTHGRGMWEVSIPASAFNVTGQFTISNFVPTLNRITGQYRQTVSITNNGAALDNVAYVLDSLNAGWTLANGDGTTVSTTPTGSPYKIVGAVGAGATATFQLTFTRVGTPAFGYTPRVLDGTPR